MKYVKNSGVVVLLASVCSFAGIDLRVGGGLNLSNEIYWGDFAFEDHYNKKLHAGFNAGVSMALYFTNHFGAIAGLGYETRGFGWKIDRSKLPADASYEGPNSAEFSLNYLQIPLHFSYRPISALAIAIGPELGIFLGGKSKADDFSLDLDKTKPIDFGASITVDYTIANMIAVGAGYYFGFYDIDDRPRGDWVKGSITHTNIKLSAAYVFHLKK